MSTLSREQLCTVVDQATSGHHFSQVEVLSIEHTIKCHDAAQRDLLRQREEEIAVFKATYVHQDVLFQCQDQLAAMTAERDRKRGLIKDLTQALLNRNEQLAAVTHELRERAKDCAEHCEDFTRAQLKLNAVTQERDALKVKP